MITRRKIIEVPFNLHQGIRIHPAIVLSTDEAIRQEGSFVALMMKTIDDYSFPLTEEMLTKKLSVNFCQARLHLISMFHDYEVINNSNQNNLIKEKYFMKLIQGINEQTFGLESE